MMILSIVFGLLISHEVKAFEPTYLETEKFQVRAQGEWSRMNQPKFCKFESYFDTAKNQIKLRMGVVGSPVDFFGWNSSLDLEDLPLEKGFEKNFKVAGNTTMILKYDGKVLSFQRAPSEKIWNRLYPFQVEIDPMLTRPGKFKGSLEGYETNFLGLPKKHVTQNCSFN